jgi:hypothetical protein
MMTVKLYYLESGIGMTAGGQYPILGDPAGRLRGGERRVRVRVHDQFLHMP